MIKKTIISIDQAGKGITGYLIVKNHGRVDPLILFSEYKSENWEEHLNDIIEKVIKVQPDIVLFENTTYLYGRQHQGTTNLYKLTGGIVGIFKIINHEWLNNGWKPEIGSIAVNSVKALRSKIQKGTKIIEGLSYEVGRGKGWRFKYQTIRQAALSDCNEKWKRISLHMTDALIIYHLWVKENLPSEKDCIKEINELVKKNKRLGKNQKKRLEKLKKIAIDYKLDYKIF